LVLHGIQGARRTGGGVRDEEAMTDASAIEAATRRLAAALDALEAAVERRREADRSEGALAAQVQALGTDRSKLASELDGVTAHSRRLEATNRDIAQRLDVAIDSIRAVIEAQQ
jgi:Rad3-related DNA helicase